MEAERFRCKKCGKLKLVRRKGQRYCSDTGCQQARKNLWRRRKYAEDVDYRLNQRSSTEAWLVSVGGSAKYYREYRKKRKQGQNVKSANRDARNGESLLKSGRYLIFPTSSKTTANRDAIEVRIEMISDRYP